MLHWLTRGRTSRTSYLRPDGSPSTDVVQPGEVALPEVCPAPRGGIDLELAKALLDVSVLPMVVTPSGGGRKSGSG